MKIKLTENKLKQIVAETVKNVLLEDIDDDNYFGGGLPDKYFDDNSDAPDINRINKEQLYELNEISQRIADIANNLDEDTKMLFDACNCIDAFISNFEHID